MVEINTLHGQVFSGVKGREIISVPMVIFISFLPASFLRDVGPL